MIIVKYQSSGMKSVVNDDATAKDFSALYKRWKAKAEDDEDMYVTWLGTGQFEVTNDRWADSFIFCTRPADWPIKDGEPK